jgi:hypothetical protein
MKILKNFRKIEIFEYFKVLITNQKLRHKQNFFIFAGVPWNFTFNVKFYPPDPAQLTEDITR